MNDLKRNFRQEIFVQCNSLTQQYRDKTSNLIFQNCKNMLIPKQKIAIYRAFGWEANLNTLIKYCISINKRLYQPVAFKDSQQMLLEPYNSTKKNIFTNKIEANMQEFGIKWYNLDLIFLPLVAVDKLGYRLGKGGGYYDVTLSQINEWPNPPILCGIGYSCQLVEQIPKDPWDIQLDYFVSEHGLIKF